MIRFLENLKLRRKLLVAMVPLALMVIIAGMYSSRESRQIDTQYSQLLSQDVGALQHLTEAKAEAALFGQLLYEEIAELDVDKMHRIDSELDKTYANYRVLIHQSLQESRNRGGEIKAAEALFDHAVLDSGPVRATTLVNSNTKAMDLMRASVDAELQRAREAIADIVQDIRKSVDQQSDELTRKTRQAILYTWLVIGFGLAATFALALFIMQSEVVRELFSLRDSIQDLAAGKLDQTIPYLDRNNEIGEISRALQTLQRGAREREIQGWVKSEVASTLARLQAVRDFPEFATYPADLWSAVPCR
jgi:two-component system sensor histidine kinase/response regulator